MSIQEVAKDCESFGGADGSHLLHLCFDPYTEYDPDVVLDKKKDFLRFLLKILLKLCFLFKSRGSVLYLDVLHVQLLYKNILGAMTF